MSIFFAKNGLTEQKSDIVDYVPIPFFAVLYGKKGNVLEICSRKLAVLLRLKEGVRTTEDMLLKQIGRSKESFRKEEQMIGFGDKKIRLVYHPVLNAKTKTVSAEIFWFYDETDTEKEKNALLSEKEKLAEGLKTLHFILNKLPEILWIKDGGEKIIYANRRYAEAVGEESPGNVLENQTAFLKTGVIEGLEQAARQTGEIQKQEIDIVMGGGKTVYEMTILPLTENETLGIGRDMSKEAKTRESVKEELDILDEVFRASENGIVVFDKDGYVLKANDMFLSLFKIPEGLVEERVSFGILLEKMKEEGTAPIATDFKEYKKRETEKIKKAKESSKELLSCPKGIIMERSRRKVGKYVVDFFTDKTESIRETREAKLERQILNQLTADLPFGILKIDAEKRVIGWNDRFKEKWHLSKTFLERAPHVREVFAEQSLKMKKKVKDFEKQLLAALETKNIEQVDLGETVLHIIRLKDGSMWLNYL